MKPHPRCFYCGVGLSRKHRVTDPETRLMAAIWDVAIACKKDTDRILATRAPRRIQPGQSIGN